MPETNVNASNVSTGKPKIGGSVFRAPKGTTLPTDAVTALNEAFNSMGYISEDGVSNDTSRETQKIKAWGGDTVLEPLTDKSDRFTMTFIEGMRLEVLKAVHGDSNVTGDLDTGITVQENSSELGYFAWVVEMILSEGVLKRLVIPEAQITSVAEVVYKDTDAIGYNSTLSARPDSSGNTHYEYFKKP